MSSEERREGRRSARDRSRVLSSGFNSAVKLVDGLQFLKLEEPGMITLDILPYHVGKNNHVATRVGELWWELTYWIHKYTGIDEKTYIAGKTFHKTDYLAEKRAKLAKLALPASATKEEKEAHKDMLYRLSPSNMQMFFVRTEDDPEIVQVWDISPFKFGSVLQDQIDQAPESKGWEYFYDPDENGFKLEITFKKDSFSSGDTSGKFLKATRIDFVRRSDREVSRVKELHALILEKGWALENFLVETPYDVLRRAVEGIPDDEGDHPHEEQTESQRQSEAPAREMRREEPPRDSHPTSTKEERIERQNKVDPEDPAKQQRVTDMGYLAQQNGDKRADNPFDEGTPRYQWWQTGWLKAIDEASDKKVPPKEELKPVTAASLGIKKGDTVLYKDGKCELMRINDDGTLNLLDANDDMQKNVPVAQVITRAAAQGGTTETPKEAPKSPPAQSQATEQSKSSNAGGVDADRWDDWRKPGE